MAKKAIEIIESAESDGERVRREAELNANIIAEEAQRSAEQIVRDAEVRRDEIMRDMRSRAEKEGEKLRRNSAESVKSTVERLESRAKTKTERAVNAVVEIVLDGWG